MGCVPEKCWIILASGRLADCNDNLSMDLWLAMRVHAFVHINEIMLARGTSVPFILLPLSLSIHTSIRPLYLPTESTHPSIHADSQSSPPHASCRLLIS